MVSTCDNEDLFHEVGQLVHLTMHQDKKVLRLPLIVVSVTRKPLQNTLKKLNIMLRSPVVLLTQPIKTRHYVNTPLRDILADIISSNHKFIWPCRIVSNVPDVVVPFAVQYGESDWDFWRRLCMLHGIWFYMHWRDQSELVVCPPSDASQVDALNLCLDDVLQPPAHCLTHFTRFYLRTPSVANRQSASVPLCFHDFYSTENSHEGKNKQRALHQAQLAWQSCLVIARSSVICHQVDDVIKTKLGIYKVLCVDRNYVATHQSHVPIGYGSGYTILTLIPAATIYHQCCESTVYLPDKFWQDELGYVPMFAKAISPKAPARSFMTARVSTDTAMVKRDNRGRYATEFSYPSTPHYIESLYPCAYPKGSGFVFDHPRGAEVMLSHIENDLNRPIILGGYFSAQNGIIAKQQASNAHVIQIPGHLRFALKDGKNGRIEFCSKINHMIFSHSNIKKSIEIFSGCKIKILSQKLRISSERMWYCVAESMHLNTAFRQQIACGGVSTIKSGNDLYGCARQCMEVLAANTIQGRGDRITLAGLTYASQAESVKLYSLLGEIGFRAKGLRILLDANGYGTFKVGSKKLLRVDMDGVFLTASQNLTLQADEILCQNGLWIA